MPLLRELRTSFQHKNAVKGVVQEFLERKTFALPMGIPLAFDRMLTIRRLRGSPSATWCGRT